MKQAVVIGLGRFGSTVAKTLAEQKWDVLAIDKDAEKVEEISPYVTQAVQADATDEKNLKELGITDMDVAIICIGEDIGSNILTTLLLKDLGVKYIAAKCENELHGKVLKKIGVNKIVFPERDSGKRLVNSLISPDIIDYITLSPEYNITELAAPQKFVGKTFQDLDLSNKYKINVIAIRRKEPYITEEGESEFKEEIIIAPSKDSEIRDGDLLLVIGKKDDINKFKSI